METISFRGNVGVLHGYLFKPAGNKPFPAVIFLRDSMKPLLKSGPSTQFENLARFWTSRGFLLFIPDYAQKTRTRSDANDAQEDPDREDKFVMDLQAVHKDVISATVWLKHQTFADDSRIVMMGSMQGGMHTIISAEKGLGLKAFIPFSPAALSWRTHPSVQAVLRRGIRNSKTPIFLIQTQNDTSLAPSAILGKELMNKGRPNRTRVYPPFGKSNLEARNFAYNGPEIWGPDVMAFLDDVLSP